MRPTSMTFKRTYLISMLVIICVAIGFAGGYLFHDRASAGADRFPLFREALDILTNHGLRPAPTEPELEYGMIRGVLQEYADPYSVFVEPAQHELESNALAGSFGGIGVRLIRDATGQVVLYPYPDSPAKSAGVEDGDFLIAVDDLEITNELPMDAIQAKLRGEVGQTVTIHLRRPPAMATYTLLIRRVEFSIPSVAWRLDADHSELGILEVNMIAASTTDEIRKATDDLQTRGATAIILDLRNNYGGLLTAGVDIARLYLESGVVMENQYRDQTVETYKVEKPGPYRKIPLAVLVNDNTASAAEIIAGALKVHGRAPIIGTPTFGKDTIQLVFSLRDGSSLHVTAARWWIPGLDPPIGEGGIRPDVYISPGDDPNQGDPVMRAASEALLR